MRAKPFFPTGVRPGRLTLQRFLPETVERTARPESFDLTYDQINETLQISRPALTTGLSLRTPLGDLPESMNQDRICCDTMRVQLTHECEQHPDPFDCPDVLVVYNAKFDEYGMPIRDGGPSVMSMQFCPWCGTQLPESKRDLWFNTLAALGFDDPSEQPISDEFRSDEWWRNRD